jgi:hypothetical protein
LERLRGAVQGMTPEQVHAETQATEQANPIASGVGTVAGTVLPFMGAGAIPGVGRVLGMTGNLGSRMGFGLLSGGAISGADAKARGKSDNEAITDAAIGGGIGAAFPLVGAGLRRLVSPLPMSASQRAAAQTMEREGVTLTAGQRTGSKKLKYLESELGGGAADAVQEQQARQFTRAVLRRAGVDADSVDPQVLDQTFDQIGQRFDTLASRTTVPLDTRLQNDLLRTVVDYQDSAGNPARAVERVLNRIGELARNGGGALMGDAYQNIRSEIGALSKSADGPTKQALRDMQGALDDAVGRHVSPQFRQAWSVARRQYKNLLVIEKAATGAGEQAASGVITPARLRSAAIAQNRRAFARGRNDFTDLANAAVQTMTPLPQSGTSPRLAARGFSAIPAAVGAAAGAPGGILGAAAGAAIGAGVPWAAGRAALSAPGRAILSNQMLAGPAGRALIAPAVPGMLAEQKREPVMITVRGGR